MQWFRFIMTTPARRIEVLPLAWQQEFFTEIRQSNLNNSRLFAQYILVFMLFAFVGVSFIHIRFEALENYRFLVVMNLLIVGISLAFLYISRPIGSLKLLRRWHHHRWYCLFITIISNGFFYLQWHRLGHNSAYFIIQFIYAVLWSYPDRWDVWFYGVNFVYYMLIISTGQAQDLVRLSGYFTGFSILSITWISERIILDLRLRDFQLRKTVDEQAQELQKVNRELNLIAFQDALTGLANRRALDDFLAGAWTRGATTQMPLALLLSKSWV